MIEWLNSRAISTVKIMPKTAWNTPVSAGSSSPDSTSMRMRKLRWITAAAITSAMRPVSTSETTCSKRS